MGPQELDEVVKKAVRETLFQIGIIVEDTDDVVQFRQDMMHLRKWRKAVESIENRSMGAAVGVLITGLFAVILVGLKSMFGHH